MTDATEKRNPSNDWWRGAVIYQIYPRSYADSNDDGIGDLAGITSKLDYVASLGVDGIWISPFFKSPMKDFGYDVADYCAVDPIFGTLKDFDRLIEAAHARSLKVIIDMVFAHTSDAHAWFADSRASRNSACSDWYVWRDAKSDGSPPTNWQSVFGGPAWTWDSRRCQYYMHQFLASQPQLNVHNRDVQDALLAEARFWLERGVDGFRLDAINHAMFDPEFRDNPPEDSTTRKLTRSFDMQKQIYSQNHADIPAFLERIRALTDEFDGVFTVAEVGGAKVVPLMQAYTDTNRLSSAYSFDFLYAPDLTPARVKAAQSNWLGQVETGWPSWAFSNHDAPRCISRWFDGADLVRAAKLTNTLLVCLRGNPILYQGEELGLTQGDVAFEDLQDPEAIANWPLTFGRDGARTPMAWTDGNTHAGFSTHKPWLPVGSDHAKRAVSVQEQDPNSVLNFTRALLKMRTAQDALKLGDIAFQDVPEPLLAFERAFGTDRILCVFNLGREALVWPTALPKPKEILIESGWSTPDAQTIPAISALIYRP